MARKGIDVFRSLVKSLETTASTGAVKPTRYGPDSRYPNDSCFGWAGSTHPLTNAYLLRATSPTNSITVHLSLNGNIVQCSLTINLGKGRKFGLYSEPDIIKLESLIENLRELAQWL